MIMIIFLDFRTPFIYSNIIIDPIYIFSNQGGIKTKKWFSQKVYSISSKFDLKQHDLLTKFVIFNARIKTNL